MPPPAGFASPVPAHSVPSEPMASAPIVWVLLPGQTEVNVMPSSVLFQMPPPAAAT